MKKPIGHAACAVTLVELVLSVTVLTLLLAAISSAIILATQAVPTEDAAAVVAGQQRRILAQFADELRFATAVAAATATELAFTTQDRDGDGDPDHYTYRWETPDQLVKVWPGGMAQTLTAAWSDGTFTYTTTDTVAVIPGLPVEGPRRQLINLSGGDGAGEDGDDEDEDGDSETLDAGERAGQTFRPPLPTDAVAWSVTRIRVRLAGVSNEGQLQIGVHATTRDGLPRAVPLNSIILDAEALDTELTWHDLSIANVTDISPDRPLALVITALQGNPAAGFAYHDDYSDSALAKINAVLWLSSDGGRSWRDADDAALQCAIFGTVTLAGTDTTEPRRQLERVAIQYTTGRPARTVAIDCVARNQPVLP